MKLVKMCVGSFDELQHISKRAIPSVGVVELFVEDAMVMCRSASGEWLEQSVILPPVIVQSTGASCMFAALDQVRELSIDNTNRIATSVTLVIHTKRPDAAKANLRLQQHVGLPAMCSLIVGRAQLTQSIVLQSTACEILKSWATSSLCK